MLMSALLLLLPAAWAGGSGLSQRVTLVLCPDVTACADQMMWISGLKETTGDSILLADTVLELEGGGWKDGIPIADRLRADLDKARTEMAARRTTSADGALEDAREAVDRWNGTVSGQDLFDLYYLRGALRLAQDRPATDAFRQAAILAWNRTVTFPLDDEAAATAYYAAQAAVLAEGTGTIHVESMLPSATIALDGVPLGPAPVDVHAFSGRHRLTATQEGTTLRWKRDIFVRPDEIAQAEARFDRSGDANWVYDQLLLSLSFRTLDAAVANLLSDWARQENVKLIRVAHAERIEPKSKKKARKVETPRPEATDEVVLDGVRTAGEAAIPVYEDPTVVPVPSKLMDLPDTAQMRYRLVQALYDPQLRRFVEE